MPRGRTKWQTELTALQNTIPDHHGSQAWRYPLAGFLVTARRPVMAGCNSLVGVTHFAQDLTRSRPPGGTASPQE
jgi:hypothetical protein